MKSHRHTVVVSLALVTAVAGCAFTPVMNRDPVVDAPWRAGTDQTTQSAPIPRPPDKRFGTLQELGSLDIEPDVTSMIEYQQQRKSQRAAVAVAQKAAPQWTALGPNNNLGRVIDIAFHPQNSNILYIASPGGGAYKSTDGGGSWTWLGGLPYQAINSIAIDPQNPNVIYFATGHFQGSGSDFQSMGIYKTTDGGATFNLLTSTVPSVGNIDWLRVTRVVTHPAIPNLIFAGATSGFFLSNNGGTTWTKSSTVPTYDIVTDPNDPAKMLRGRFDGSISHSTNAGANWTTAAIVTSSATANIHTRVKYAKSAPNVVYAAVNQNVGELHRSDDGGVTWAIVSTPAHNGTQGFHTNQLWVSPVDANHLIVGGVDLYKSLDGGQSFVKISNWQSNSAQTGAGLSPRTPHADHNAIASPPDYSEATALLLVGTDGGLYATANARDVTESSGWSKSNGNLSLSQFVGGAGRRANGIDTLVGGLQDNGTVRHLGAQNWERLGSGDGGFIAIADNDGAIFGSYQNGRVHRCIGCVGVQTICAGITEVDPENCGSSNTLKVNFYAPLELDSSNGGRLYLGANSLWVSTNPRSSPPSWSVVKEPVAGSTVNTATSNYINAISIHQADPNIVLAGHNDGQVFRTRNILSGAPTWATVSGNLPSRLVGAVLVDPVDSERLYIGFAGYFADNLWRSDNGGASWKNISAGLPPGSIYTITRHPLAKEKIYVGTIWGSYGSDNAGDTWPATNDGPYGTQIRKLFWLGSDTLVAATFGAGMVKATVTAAVTGPANYSDMWWAGTSENGWGMSIQQHGNTQFNAIYVYDSAGKPVWYVMPGGQWNANFTSYSGPIFQPTSAPLNNYNPAQFFAGNSVGNVTITFTGAANATLQYTINGIAGQKSIQRQVFGSGTAPLSVGDMWWGDIAQNGWGVNIVQHAGSLFGVWFTYGPDGKAIWYVLPAGDWVGNTYSGDFYSTTGSAWLGVTYNPALLAATKAGTMSFNFSNANNATFTYSFTAPPYAGTTQSKAIVRQVY